jgi:predicted ester cyclase
MPDGRELPPTGKTVRVPVVSVLEMRNGKATAERVYFDMAAMLTQLGLLPTG